MNRIIKFRAKRKDNHQWGYGSHQHVIRKGKCDLIIDWVTNNVYEVHSETLGMLSEFIDSEGKEVYEGDIISHPKYFETPEMSYNPQQFGLIEFKDFAFRIYDDILSDDDKENNDYFFVTGNIHDNPELIILNKK